MSDREPFDDALQGVTSQVSGAFPSTLITKVLLPQRRKDVLSRQRLLDCLYDMVDRKLVLISAPAGYGKTTLLVDWAQDLEHPVCWYALDQGDHDPRVFLEHLVLCLQHRFPDFGARTRRVLAATPSLAHGAPSVVNVLVNEMADVIPRWFALVLDDYHRLEPASHVGAILARLLACQTDQFLLIVASRSVPELPYTIQLAARGEGGGIGQQDLRFRAGEIQKMLAQNYDLHISEQEAQELAEQSEGWITGILLTAHTAWRGVFASLARANISQQLVFEYLAQEIFARQEPAVQAFLMASSTLQEMSPDLCYEALGLKDAAHFLTLLEKRNLFIMPLEEEWRRYHHLFQAYLQTQLRREKESAWVELHRRAARWLEAHQHPEQAVHHYLAIGAYESAAQVMETSARDMFYAGRLQTLMRWGTGLPDSLRERYPRLALFHSRAADALGQWEQALALTEIAERGCRAKKDRRNLAFTLLHRCQVWQAQGEFQKALALGQTVLALVRETDVPVAYEAHHILGRSLLALGALEEGETHLRQALDYSWEQGSAFEQSSIQNTLADCLGRQGRWGEAVAVQKQAVATRRQLDNPAALAIMLNDLGFLLYQSGEYGEALCLLEEALELARRSGQRRGEASALLSLGELIRDLGALERAAEILQAGLCVADELGEGFLSAYGREALGLVQRCQGDYARAQANVEEAIKRAQGQRSEYQLGRYQASLGLLRAEAGELDAGLLELAQASEQLQRIGAHGELVRAQFFTAWALFLASDETKALATLQETLATANLAGQASLLVIEGQRALPLLEHAHSHQDNEELAALLAQVRAFEHTAQATLQQVSCLEGETKTTLRVFGFGPGRAERRGEPIPVSDWEAAATRYMFFYLLTHAPRSREQIAAVLWPELPASKVKANFHTTKFRLKRALGQEPLCFDDNRYQIHPELNYWFDVQEFQRLLEETGPRRSAERLQQAIALYQSDFLEDCYADWCLPLREQLRAQCLQAIEELAEHLLARRRYRRAIQTLRRGLELDDLREEFHCLLMRAYALSGRRSQALVQYRRCVEILQRELGVSASPATVELHRRILDGSSLD